LTATVTAGGVGAAIIGGSSMTGAVFIPYIPSTAVLVIAPDVISVSTVAQLSALTVQVPATPSIALVSPSPVSATITQPLPDSVLVIAPSTISSP
jgi:hypothetical protein